MRRMGPLRVGQNFCVVHLAYMRRIIMPYDYPFSVVVSLLQSCRAVYLCVSVSLW